MSPDTSARVSVAQALRDCEPTDADRCTAAIDLKHRQWREEFVEKSYQWHLFSTRVIFWLVVSIVTFGLYITYVQFTRDYRGWSAVHGQAPPSAAADPAQAAGEQASRPVSTVKLGPGGLELSSQVIGLIVLALSFGFFYEYIRVVYPMVEDQSTRGVQTDPSNGK
jgi:hypothetical protein